MSSAVQRRSATIAQVPGGMTYTFKRAKCTKVLPMTEMSPHRRNVCIKDTRSYKSLNERWTKNRASKTWWGALTPEAHIAWYCKHHEVQAAEKRKYQEISHAESSISQERMGEDEVDRFIPWDVFEERGLETGRTSSQLEQDFIDIVQSGAHACLYRRNQRLVPRFMGVERRRGWENLAQIGTQRKASNLTPEDLQALRRCSEKLRDEFGQKCPIAIVPPPSALPHIDSRHRGAIQREAV